MTGSVETAVRADIAKLGILSGIQPSLAEVAYALARKLDHPELFKGQDPTAAIAKQLVETMEKLAPGGESDAFLDAYNEFAAKLGTPMVSPPLGNTTDS